MHKGFIKLHRRIRSHWLYEEKRSFSKFEAWIDLIMRANYKDRKIVLGNDLIDVSKGQFITSELKLMDAWGWGKGKTRNFLKLLEQDGMIVRKADRKKTTITICNYCTYHDNEKENRPQADHERTANGLSSDTEKNLKEVKEGIKKDYRSKIIDLLSVFSSIDNFTELNKKYWDVVRETRVTKNISESVIYRNMNTWKKYDLAVVEYALKNHIENHKGKREEYTIGIMRNTSPEEASERLKSGMRGKASNDIDWEGFDLSD